ncbi:periplasmic binding protein [Paenibacillus curdlanolyticus YK9]|uniref:Periplasmic binding protein n=1 Tax=Paenibacillus curdlanolyticus YK9 TaxID=717606 RepID=E0IB00_9BACL|nr:stalk domain-containing protein [Paenibacillus curdlanolyticus]EFM10291.1 periplasmic binding protein [Paenibacillus curdlanolyticus YK9]
MHATFKSRFIALMLILAISVAVVPFTANAAGAVSVTLNGSKLSFETSPVIKDGTTLVPYRTIAEKLNAKVGWNKQTQKVTVTKGTKTVVLTVGSKTATVNGKSVKLDAVPTVKNGTTLVPLRFLGESLGIWVNWKAATSTVALETKRTISHAMGSTTLTSVPQRVVVLTNGLVDASVYLGIKPVGAVESYSEQPWYAFLRSGMTGVKNLGDETQPNLEAIVKLKPDLIIGSKMRHEKIYSQLKAIAPTLMTEDVFSFKSTLALEAKALNKETKADAFLASWNSKVAAFKKEIGSKAKSTEVSVIRFNPDGSSRAYLDGFAINILKELGFKLTQAQLKARVGESTVVTVTNQEQTKLLDADYIFDFTTDWVGDGGVYKVQKDWTSSALWKNLDAVKNGKYYKVNVITWNYSAGPMAAKAMLDDLYFYFDLE